MLHLVTRVLPNIPVVFLDTGYLFPETYQFARQLAERLSLNLKVYAPKVTAARQEALFGKLWRGDENDLAKYNYLNKVEPMNRALHELSADAWLAGVRGTQTAFRSQLRALEEHILPSEENREPRNICKVHPILGFSDNDIDDYLEQHNLPRHPLVAFGYRSIGDTHSTFPTTDEEDARNGRTLGDKRECGIHLPHNELVASSLKSSGL